MSGGEELGGDRLVSGRDQMIPALLREREGYVRSGRTDRVRAVDEQLAAWGYDPEVGFELPETDRPARLEHFHMDDRQFPLRVDADNEGAGA